MKKAGIITHYEVHNHGAVLQLYGMIKELEKFGYEARALRFNKNYDFIGGNEASKKYNISIKSVPIYIKYLFKNGIGRTLYNYKKRRTLNHFKKNEFLVGDFYANVQNLDLVTIGADEIFSIEAGPNPWYYGAGISCKKFISYAASFGPTTYDIIENKHMVGMVGGAIRELESISVRDLNSYNIVKKITGRESSIVCDPVLLYGFHENRTDEVLASFKKRIRFKYCVVYSYDYNMNDEETISSIKKYAKSKGLTIVSVGYYHKWCDKNVDVYPLDIFRWFACAEMVFTDTFHGSVISLTTNAQFVTKINANANKLEFLMKQFCVEDRIVKQFSDVFDFKEIDYSRVNSVIERVKESSFSFLNNAIGEKYVDK